MRFFYVIFSVAVLSVVMLLPSQSFAFQEDEFGGLQPAGPEMVPGGLYDRYRIQNEYSDTLAGV